VNLTLLDAAPIVAVIGALVFGIWLSLSLSVRRDGASAEKAQRLLKGWLTEDQRRQYEREGQFEVIGSATGARYLIRKGWAGNVIQLDQNGLQVASLCFAPEGNLPVGDVLLAQKISLETNEATVLAIANRTLCLGC